MNEETRKRIEELLAQNKVVVFIKGEPDGSMCGFSARVVEILETYGVDFAFFNVLEDEAMWGGIKEYGNWPTIPQLYVNGKLIGGCDITLELDKSGELKKVLGG